MKILKIKNIQRKINRLTDEIHRNQQQMKRAFDAGDYEIYLAIAGDILLKEQHITDLQHQVLQEA